MPSVTAKKKPGRDHFIPEAARKIWPEKQVSTANWATPKSYEGHEEWPPEKWAWEFLRRNRFFQQDCDALEGARSRKKKLPAHWHLASFKSYAEPYKHVGSAIPGWTIFSKVEVWDTNTRFRLARPPVELAVDDLVLQPGQIALVLDLNQAAAIPELMRAQWSSAWYHMAASAARLHASRKRNSEKYGTGADMTVQSGKRVSKPHPNSRIDYLRLADAFSMQFPPSLEDVCKQFFADERLQIGAKEMRPVAARNSMKKMIEAARSAVYGQGYLLLVEEGARAASWKEKIAPYWPSASETDETTASATKQVAEKPPPDPFAIMYNKAC